MSMNGSEGVGTCISAAGGFAANSTAACASCAADGAWHFASEPAVSAAGSAWPLQSRLSWRRIFVLTTGLHRWPCARSRLGRLCIRDSPAAWRMGASGDGHFRSEFVEVRRGGCAFYAIILERVR